MPLIENPGDTARVIQSARRSQRKWARRDIRSRTELLRRLRRDIMEQRDAIVDDIRKDTAKTRVEALSSSLLPTLECLHYIESRAAEVLRPQKRPTPPLYRSTQSRVEYHPRGVVLVISPWNNPFQLCLLPVASALTSGNAIVLKPSEHCPTVARRVSDLLREAGYPEPLTPVCTGGPDVARGLLEAKPDMIFFTGCVENGRDVLRAAARSLTPTVLELGGKDPMIVLPDAPMDRAVEGGLYGAFTHAGQHCVSTRRLYLHRDICQQFLDQLSRRTEELADTEQWGTVRFEQAAASARELVQDALSRGAELLNPADPADAGFRPTLLRDVTHDMRIVREDLFAPVLVSADFSSEDEALALANDTPFGLNASIWTGDREKGRRIARGLNCGNIFINNVLSNVGNPHLPFGGTKQSGLGRYHGPEGLRTFCRTTSVMARAPSEREEPNWFPHDEHSAALVDGLLRLRHEDMSFGRKILQGIRLARLFWKGE
ncbi:MAG: aldehyde dehydrogenase family protein [Planctomycetota bacterium]